MKDRFKKTTAAAVYDTSSEERQRLMKRFLEWVSSFGKYAAKDKEDTSKLRSALIQAGFRHPKATAIFFGFKVLGLFFFPLPYLLANAMNGTMASGNLALCLIMAGPGSICPNFSSGP